MLHKYRSVNVNAVLLIIFISTTILVSIVFDLYFFQSCLLDNECKAFQFSTQEKENCALIHEATQNDKSYVSNEQNLIYEKGWFKKMLKLFTSGNTGIIKYLKQNIKHLVFLEN